MWYVIFCISKLQQGFLNQDFLTSNIGIQKLVEEEAVSTTMASNLKRTASKGKKLIHSQVPRGL